MRKFIVSMVVALVVLCGVSFYVYKTNDVSETYENNETKKVNNNMLSMMLETSAGSGAYQQTTASAWPTEGYVFNENLSRCEQGSSLSWDNVNKKVIMEGSSADKCYVYFDKTITLVDYVKAQYAGTQGENNLYYHDSTLENGAGDNSYRYAGSSDTTNNFVCFGYDSTDGSCPTDNLYRIIGVFENQVKLIKYDYVKPSLLGTDGDYDTTYSFKGLSKGENSINEIGGYYWNRSSGTISSNKWSESRLNKINLNTNYLNNISEKWANMINTHKWIVGGNTQTKIVNEKASVTYQNEIISPAENTTYDAKVGLMYVSDYGFAAAKKAWDAQLSSYNQFADENWMYMGLLEFPLTRMALSETTYVIEIDRTGLVDSTLVYVHRAIRPVFYLNSNVTYVSGSGTKENPILIN